MIIADPEFTMIPYIRGLIAKQAHVSVPDGTVEEEYARNGFSGKYAHLYRSSAPTNWLEIEGPLKPRSYDLQKQVSNQIANRNPLLKNDEVEVSFITLKEEMPFYFRNADGDDLFFVHSGTGKMETDFGPMEYGKGDYLLIPRGTVYRFFPKERSEFLLIESFGELHYPDRGMLGQHALFDPAVIEVPTPNPTPSSQSPSKLKVKRLGEITTITYPSSPINTVGWKGTLSVQKLNVRDIRPVLSDRYHLPPSAHTTFVGNKFVVCTFLPRPLENGDPQAMKVPFYHSNIDFDEVLFYHSGQFFSREGISPGMLTFHPQGIHHGPQPKAVERSKDLKSTSEVAVMIDTKNPLFPTALAETCENKNYWKSWQE
jgi:homogentisate 1,2-dioxygenase